MARRTVRSRRNSAELEPIVQLWILRILMKTPAHTRFVRRDCFNDDTLAERLSLEQWVDVADEEFEPTRIRAELRSMLREAEQRAHETKPTAQLRGNIKRLAKLVGLSDLDCRILEFAVLLHSESPLDDAADCLESLSSSKVFHSLGLILDLPEPQVRAALGPRSLLQRSGLLSVEHNGSDRLRSKLTLLSHTFADQMISSDNDPIDLLRDTVRPAPPPELDMGDYEHVRKSLAVLRPYLHRTGETGQRGVNILLHGVPGTGKSQLARVLAADLGCELFEVASEDSGGDPIDSKARLRAFRAAQSFFDQRRALIVFDEIEDVFNDGESAFAHLFGGGGTAQKRKAWMNRMLEDNPVPTLWLSNSIWRMDPAFIRRFDMIIELPIPPRRQRRRLIEQVCRDVASEASVARLAEVEKLAPAVVTRAASVVRTISADLDETQRQEALESIVSATLEAQGHAGLRRHDPNRLPELYDPAFINADADLARLAAGLRDARAGRLCLFGPPGTGKTAYGRWLAEQLDAPLLVQRASDLLSKWVGGTEKNIRNAFREAEQEGAVLLIDEVDSFLQDRRGAQRSWEVTEVNEMLTQMESFAGVFIASTNLMDGLDQAALRRFDIKIRFDFLRTDQAWELLRRHCAALGLPEPGVELRRAVDRTDKLAPGDFTTVARQHRFHPIASAAEFVAVLDAECLIKDGAKPAVGFVH